MPEMAADRPPALVQADGFVMSYEIIAIAVFLTMTFLGCGPAW
jgi:hypothetical protein